MIKIDSKIPEGPVAEKWTNYKAHQKLVNPANKRRLDIIVVGTGLAPPQISDFAKNTTTTSAKPSTTIVE